MLAGGRRRREDALPAEGQVQRRPQLVYERGDVPGNVADDRGAFRAVNSGGRTFSFRGDENDRWKNDSMANCDVGIED